MEYSDTRWSQIPGEDNNTIWPVHDSTLKTGDAEIKTFSRATMLATSSDFMSSLSWRKSEQRKRYSMISYNYYDHRPLFSQHNVPRIIYITDILFLTSWRRSLDTFFGMDLAVSNLPGVLPDNSIRLHSLPIRKKIDAKKRLE